MTHQKLHGHDSPILTEAQVNIWYSDQQFSFRLFVLRVRLCLCEENNPILAFRRQHPFKHCLTMCKKFFKKRIKKKPQN